MCYAASALCVGFSLTLQTPSDILFRLLTTQLFCGSGGIHDLPPVHPSTPHHCFWLAQKDLIKSWSQKRTTHQTTDNVFANSRKKSQVWIQEFGQNLPTLKDFCLVLFVRINRDPPVPGETSWPQDTESCGLSCVRYRISWPIEPTVITSPTSSIVRLSPEFKSTGKYCQEFSSWGPLCANPRTIT